MFEFIYHIINHHGDGGRRSGPAIKDSFDDENRRIAITHLAFFFCCKPRNDVSIESARECTVPWQYW